jgi:hypothetical protein
MKSWNLKSRFHARFHSPFCFTEILLYIEVIKTIFIIVDKSFNLSLSEKSRSDPNKNHHLSCRKGPITTYSKSRSDPNKDLCLTGRKGPITRYSDSRSNPNKNHHLISRKGPITTYSKSRSDPNKNLCLTCRKGSITIYSESGSNPKEITGTSLEKPDEISMKSIRNLSKLWRIELDEEILEDVIEIGIKFWINY